MRISTIISTVFLVVECSAAALPYEDSKNAAITVVKRQVGPGGNRPGIDMSRPSEWDDLPPLPDSVREAYEQQLELEALAVLNAWWDVDFFQDVPLVLLLQFTYLSENRILEVLQTLLPSGIAPDRKKAAVASLMEEKLSRLDLRQLEQQMQEIVQFKQQNERFGSPGQERWRHAYYWKAGDPRGLLSPFDFMDRGQSRLLAVVKARSGNFDEESLVQYLVGLNPFLNSKRAARLLEIALKVFEFDNEAF